MRPNRSDYADALNQKLADQKQRLIRACHRANQDPDIAAIERDFDELKDEWPCTPDEIPESPTLPRA